MSKREIFDAGAKVIVERDAHPVAVIRAAKPVRRKISECIAQLPAGSTATIDPDFAKVSKRLSPPIESRWSRLLGSDA